MLGLLVVTEALRRQLAPDRSRRAVLLPVLAVAPFVFPFTIGLLFGNADVFFPFLYGTHARRGPGRHPGGVCAGRRRGRRSPSLKLHPASLGLWFVGRGVWQRGRPVAAGRGWPSWVAAVVGHRDRRASASWPGARTGRWSEYVDVVRAGSGADIVDPRNAGPAAVVVGVAWRRRGRGPVAPDPGHARRPSRSPSSVAARDRDVVESFAIAAVASLVTLPVTWYHYPAALMPVAIAAILRARDAARPADRAPRRRGGGRRGAWPIVLAAPAVGRHRLVVVGRAVEPAPTRGWRRRRRPDPPWDSRERAIRAVVADRHLPCRVPPEHGPAHLGAG